MEDVTISQLEDCQTFHTIITDNDRYRLFLSINPFYFRITFFCTNAITLSQMINKVIRHFLRANSKLV